jgi:hypothetical protein
MTSRHGNRLNELRGETPHGGQATIKKFVKQLFCH